VRGQMWWLACYPPPLAAREVILRELACYGVMVTMSTSRPGRPSR
jgi:hypothetical protein